MTASWNINAFLLSEKMSSKEGTWVLLFNKAAFEDVRNSHSHIIHV